MAPVLWLLGGVVLAEVLRLRYRKPNTGLPLHPATQAALASPPSAPGVMTPARAAIHGELMIACCDPQKLKRAAALFGHEGLPQEAEALLRKASMIHEMMHGAKEIVERCRAGDQHAMAMAKAIGEQARAGSKRAQLSWFLIEDYSRQHPKDEPKLRVAA